MCLFVLEEEIVMAYHDRSAGGLFTAIAEMCFAGRCGVDVDITELGPYIVSTLFNEELAAVMQVRRRHIETLFSVLSCHGVDAATYCKVIGSVQPRVPGDRIVIRHAKFDVPLLDLHRAEVQRWWAETSYRMQEMRDDPKCAKEEYDRILDDNDPGLSFQLTFQPSPPLSYTSRPMVAILREQGVNGHIEMAAAFDRAGFQAVDVHMSDLINNRISLDAFKGLAACGGFSYGDVLGAGSGWANSILMHSKTRKILEAFLQRPDTFALGVCNGCQMMSQLKELLTCHTEKVEGKAATEHWPSFVKNESDQFEARVAMVEIMESAACQIWFKGMAGSKLPIAVAHGEGRVQFNRTEDQVACEMNGLAAMRYVDNYGSPAETYPANPNGSPKALTGFTTPDGRVLIMMPHPERVVRTPSLSWYPKNDKGECLWNNENSDGFFDSPWMRMFYNVREWVETQY